jgi:D-arabinose 1-dehydrogenase-like Zn-dependent alcohol dehydrogenase
MVANQRYLLGYGDLDPHLAATCACSGLTAYSAWKKCPELTREDTVLVIGAGGLGLAALGLAGALTKAHVVVGDIDANKLTLAADLGADVLDMSTNDAAAVLRSRLGEGVRAVIDFVGSPKTVDFAMKVAGRSAAIVIVGLFGGATPLSTALLPMRNLTLRGSYVGSLEEMKELLLLLQGGVSLNVPLSSRPLVEINQALDELAAGRIAGRVIATT